jgi:hypothetical protein
MSCALAGADKAPSANRAGEREEGLFAGECASHDVLSMTALLCLGKLAKGHYASMLGDAASAR